MIPVMLNRDREELRARMFASCQDPSGYVGTRHAVTGCAFPDGRCSPDGGVEFVDGVFVQARAPRPQRPCECRERWRIACALGDGGFGTKILEVWRFANVNDPTGIFVEGLGENVGKRIDVLAEHRPTLQHYLADPAAAFEGPRGLFLCGARSGIGKTVIGTLTIARLLQWGRETGRIATSYRGCRFMTTLEFMDVAWRGRDAFRDVIQGDSDFPQDEEVDAWSVDLFMLDEITREASSPEKIRQGREAQEMFFRHRQTIRRPTIVCGAVGRREIADRLGQQTSSLLRGTTVEVEVTGDDLRD